MMIIRSQDKKKIYNFEQIRKIDCETNSVMLDDVSVIGTYSTEEKAIKVLDMIQSAYNAIETMKIDKRTWRDNHYFQMPQDSEV